MNDKEKLMVLFLIKKKLPEKLFFATEVFYVSCVLIVLPKLALVCMCLWESEWACVWVSGKGEGLSSALVFQVLKRCSKLSLKNNLRTYLGSELKNV